MRRFVVVAVALIALLSAWWFATRSRESEAALPAAPEVEQVEEFALAAPTDSAPIETSSTAPEREVIELASVASDSTVPAQPICSVFGALVDEVGTPLERVNVRLSTFRRWSADFEGPALQPDERMRGWELETRADGRFRFDVPVPDASAMQVLSITPDPYHDSHVVRFGHDSRPALQAGELDLGTIRLATTGAIAGSVFDTSGQPLANASTRIANSRETTLGRETTSDANGRYVIGHIKPGQYGVNCKHETHVSQFHIPFDVVAGRTTDGVDFVLSESPTLKGRVVDVDGALLEGIRVWGWPQSSGSGAGATTGVDGMFTIFLPQNEPYRLEAKLDSSDAFGLGDPNVHYAPNTNDIELVLPRTLLVTVAVRDAASGAPVERFALRVERDDGPTEVAGQRMIRTNSAPQPSPKPGGEVQVRVRPGIDSYWIVAPGFADARGKFDASLAETGRVEIALGSGPSISGRALVRGEPASGVAVTLEVVSVRLDPVTREQSFTPDHYRAMQSTRTGADGRFRFTGVDRLTYRLTLRAASGESCVRVSRRSDELDLGDLDLQPSASIVGTVLVPFEGSKAALLVRLDNSSSPIQATTDAAGAFRFDGLTPGAHTLHVDSIPGRIAASGPFAVDLAPGAVEHVELDLRDRGTCEVSLRVRFSNGSAAGCRVELMPEAQGVRSHTLGRLDDSSSVTSWAPAFGRARVRLVSSSGTNWRHPTAVLNLTLGARLDETIVFDVASLAIVMPASLGLPEHASVRLSLSGGGLAEGVGADWNPREIAADDGASFDGRRLVWTRAPPGEFELSLQIFDSDQPPVHEQLSPTSFRTRQVPQFEHQVHVVLATGRETELVLP